MCGKIPTDPLFRFLGNCMIECRGELGMIHACALKPNQPKSRAHMTVAQPAPSFLVPRLFLCVVAHPALTPRFPETTIASPPALRGARRLQDHTRVPHRALPFE